MPVYQRHGFRFDHVIIDLGGDALEYGPAYAALCSCTRLDGIVIKGEIPQMAGMNATNRILEIARLFC